MIYKWFGKEIWNLLFDIENFKLKMYFYTYRLKKIPRSWRFMTKTKSHEF